jgi:transposase-like protein
LLTAKKDTASAVRFFVRLFSRLHVKQNPTKILVDKNPTYPAAIKVSQETKVLTTKTKLIKVNHAVESKAWDVV